MDSQQGNPMPYFRVLSAAALAMTLAGCGDGPPSVDQNAAQSDRLYS
jgi:hypothetical protein